MTLSVIGITLVVVILSLSPRKISEFTSGSLLTPPGEKTNET